MTRSVWTGIIVALLVLMLALLFPSGKTPASIGTQGIRIGLSSESGARSITRLAPGTSLP